MAWHTGWEHVLVPPDGEAWGPGALAQAGARPTPGSAVGAWLPSTWSELNKSENVVWGRTCTVCCHLRKSLKYRKQQQTDH